MDFSANGVVGVERLLRSSRTERRMVDNLVGTNKRNQCSCSEMRLLKFGVVGHIGAKRSAISPAQ